MSPQMLCMSTVSVRVIKICAQFLEGSHVKSLFAWLQEELAFMFEMLGLLEDALVQYDELDALFTQFVLNHVAGGTDGQC